MTQYSFRFDGSTVLDERPLHLLIQRAAALLICHQPKDGDYYGCFSGGKDSIVIKELANIAKVNVKWFYHNTTIDPPEVVQFIKEHHPDVKKIQPKHGNLCHRMMKRGIPTRFQRWCCEEYKEYSPPNSRMILGLRIAESPRRANQNKNCFKEILGKRRKNTTAVLPIRLWSDESVWEFINQHKLPYPSLYDEGFSRLGCIGCPMTSKKQRLQGFKRWPRHEQLWRRCMKKVWDQKKGTINREGNEWFGSRKFDDFEGLWQWWLSK